MGRTVGTLVALSACIAVAGCGSSPPPEAAARSYIYSDEGFALNVLPEWEIVETKKATKGRSDAATFVRALPEGAGQAVVSVTVDTASGTGDMEDYLRSNRKLFSEQIVGYDELTAALVTHASGRQACLVEATFERLKAPGDQSPDGQVRLKRFRQFAMLHRGKQYIITATGPADALDHWHGQAAVMLDSLVVW